MSNDDQNIKLQKQGTGVPAKKISDLTDNRRKKMMILGNKFKKQENVQGDEALDQLTEEKRNKEEDYVQKNQNKADQKAIEFNEKKDLSNKSSTLGGRHIYEWQATKDYSGPPMKVFQGNPLNNTSSEAVEIATFNRKNRGDTRSQPMGNNNYFYTPDIIKRDQAFADGKEEDPITGQPNKGWIFRKFAPKVDRSSPFIVQRAEDQPFSPVSAGDLTEGGEANVQMILHNLTSSLNLNEISPARAAEQVITYLVGPMQRTVEDASSQISQWENQAYNAFGVPNTGQGFVRDFLTAQLYAVATQVIFESTNGGDPEMSDPKKAAARAQLIRLALLRDKEFRMKVNDIVNRIIYQVTEVFNDGFDLVTGIFPVVGDIVGVVKDVIQQGVATSQQVIDGLQLVGSVNNIIAASKEPLQKQSGGGKLTDNFTKENFENKLFDLYTQKFIERSADLKNQTGGGKNSKLELNNLVSKMVSQPLSHVTGSDDWQIILSDTTKRISSVIDKEIPENFVNNKRGGNQRKKGNNLTKKKGILLKYKNKNGRFTKSIKVYD